MKHRPAKLSQGTAKLSQGFKPVFQQPKSALPNKNGINIPTLNGAIYNRKDLIHVGAKVTPVLLIYTVCNNHFSGKGLHSLARYFRHLA